MNRRAAHWWATPWPFLFVRVPVLISVVIVVCRMARGCCVCLQGQQHGAGADQPAEEPPRTGPVAVLVGHDPLLILMKLQPMQGRGENNSMA